MVDFAICRVLRLSRSVVLVRVDRMKLDDYLREVDERAGKATEGPWQTRFIVRMIRGARTVKGLFIETHPVMDWHDADFMAESRTDIPKLIRLLRAAMEMRSQLRGCCDEFESTEKFDSTVADILEGKDG